MIKLNRIGNKLGLAHQAGNLASVCMFQGKHEEALAHVDESLQAYRELGDLASAGQYLGTRGAILLDMGRWEEAMQTLKEAITAQHRGGYEGSRGELRDLANLVYAQFKCGAPEARARAAELLPRLLDPPPRVDFTDEGLEAQILRLKEVLT